MKEMFESKLKNIIWLTGESGSGKTTLAKHMSKELNAIILDGDEMRKSISINFGFSKKDRAEHNYKVARLAKILSKQYNVIVSVICPMQKVRNNITNLINPFWVYVERELPKRKNYFYEIPSNYFTINNDNNSINENVNKILKEYYNNEK